MRCASRQTVCSLARERKSRHDRNHRARLYLAWPGCQPGRVTPTIRYAASPAGRIAYSVTGSGPALLCDSGWVTHLRGQLDAFSFGPFVERLAERFTVIRYDKPGCGLSDRDGVDLSFDGQVAAALAVADAVRAEHFSVFGASQGGHLAATIAARHPGRVDALALYGTCASRLGPGPPGGPGLDRGPGAGPLGPGIEGPDRHLHPGPGPGGDRHPGPAPEDERIGGGGQRAPGGLLRHRRPGAAAAHPARGPPSCTGRRTRPPPSSWAGRPRR